MPETNIANLVQLMGHESDVWPIPKDTQQMFVEKFSYMNFLTIGLDYFPYPDFLINSKIISKWSIISLKSDESDKNLELLKTIRHHSQNYIDYSGNSEEINFGINQFIDYDDTKIFELDQATSRNNFVEILKNMDSLEIVKINSLGNELWILSSILECGFLPSTLLVRFSNSPDNCLKTRNFIGNLRMLGYAVLYNIENDNKYLFYYTNVSAYDQFKVDELTTQNPFTKTVINTTINSYKKFIEDSCNSNQSFDNSEEKKNSEDKKDLKIKIKNYY